MFTNLLCSEEVISRLTLKRTRGTEKSFQRVECVQREEKQRSGLCAPAVFLKEGHQTCLGISDSGIEMTSLEV